MEGGKKVSLHRFSAGRRSRVRGINAVWGILWHEQQIIACCQPHSNFKNAFQVGSVNFANSLSPPSIVKKILTGSKSGQGT